MNHDSYFDSYSLEISSDHRDGDTWPQIYTLLVVVELLPINCMWALLFVWTSKRNVDWLDLHHFQWTCTSHQDAAHASSFTYHPSIDAIFFLFHGLVFQSLFGFPRDAAGFASEIASPHRQMSHSFWNKQQFEVDLLSSFYLLRGLYYFSLSKWILRVGVWNGQAKYIWPFSNGDMGDWFFPKLQGAWLG